MAKGRDPLAKRKDETRKRLDGDSHEARSPTGMRHNHATGLAGRE